MNEPACRAHRAAILPTFLHSRPSPKFNPKTKPNTNSIAADCTLNYRRAARHPNRLRLPFCTKTRSNTAHQQVHNKSYKWSVGFNVNGRTVIAVRPTYRMTYIHHIARHRRRTCMPGVRGVYNFQGCASFTAVLETRREGRFGASPTPPARLSRSESRTDRRNGDERCTRDDGAAAAGCTHNARRSTPAHALGGRATVTAHQRRQPPRSYPNDADHRAGRPPPPGYMGLIARHRCLDHRP